jgi:hypothetical protein
MPNRDRLDEAPVLGLVLMHLSSTCCIARSEATQDPRASGFCQGSSMLPVFDASIQRYFVTLPFNPNRETEILLQIHPVFLSFLHWI